MALLSGLKCIVVAATVAVATALSIIDVGADPRQEINVTSAAYPDGLRLIALGSKTVTLQDLTIECPGFHVSGGQDEAGRLALVNVTVICNDAPSDNAVIFMDGGPLRGAVVIDNCTVTASNATQPMSELLQIREAGGRLAIRGGRFALNSTVPTHRCIDFRGVLGGAVITVENVDASVTVDLGRSSTRGTVASALRVHRMFSGSVSITVGRLVTDVTQEWNAIGVEVHSAAAGSAVTLRDVTAEVHGRAAMSALAVLRSSCTVAVDGGRFITNASLGFVDAVYLDDYGGAATITSAFLTAVAAGTDRAAARAMTTVSGQVTVVDATLTAAANNSRVEAVFSQWLSGSSAVLTIRGCTITATGKANVQAVSLQSHSGSSSVTIANSTVSALPDSTSQSASAADALLVKRISGAATVDVIDSHLVARGKSRISAASFTLGSTGASFSVTRSTLEATTVGGGGAFGINFGHTASALLLSDCTVTARSSDDEAIGVRIYERLTGVLMISRTAFAVSAASAGTDVSGTSGGG